MYRNAIVRQSFDCLVANFNAAFEAAKSALIALNTREVEGNDAMFLRGLLAHHLHMVAGGCRGWLIDSEPFAGKVTELYNLGPDQQDLFAQEASLEIVKATTLHPFSLDYSFRLITAVELSIAEAKQRGSVAYPQGEQLLREATKTARNYIRFSSEAETGDRGFIRVLEAWADFPSPTLRRLIPIIREEYCSGQMLPD